MLQEEGMFSAKVQSSKGEDVLKEEDPRAPDCYDWRDHHVFQSSGSNPLVRYEVNLIISNQYFKNWNGMDKKRIENIEVYYT